LNDWIIQSHPDLIKDLDRLNSKELEIFYKKKNKIRENPLRLKHLAGGSNCYREEITSNIRLVYYLEQNTIWLLTIGKHKHAYEDYLKRLYDVKNRLQ
jgi:mRNA-degrading endonuclease RelE of RelBE toxin-antitoxin system